MVEKSRTRLLVITGDHNTGDATKSGGLYNDEDLHAHQMMVDAFNGMSEFDVDVCADHRWLLDGLREKSADLIVNFCDTGYFNVATQEHVVPSYLEMLGNPYTGAAPAAMTLCYDKQIVRLIAEALDIQVPREAYLKGASDAVLPEFYPALIKPNRGDGSVGITKDAVVHDEAAARAYLEWLRTTLPGADALYQEYLPGPEYGIGVIGNPGSGLKALPTLEVDFSGLPKGLNPILSFESKTMPDSPYWTDIVYKRASLAAGTEALMVATCKALFQRLGLRDYARFDFRCDDMGTPKLMEVNPNPAWSYDGKLAMMAGFENIDYPGMLRMIVDTALARINA